MDRLLDFLASPRQMKLEGEETLRLLTAMEVLEARREAAELTGEERERALCSNACLLARALERGGKPVYPSGREVLEQLRVEEIARLAGVWAEFNGRFNPSVRVEQETLDELKKGWGTRWKSALSGVCSTIFGRCPRRNGSTG